MSRLQRGKGTKNAKAFSTKGIEEDVQCNSVFGRYSEAEMIAQLKGLALDPSRPQFALDNIQPLWDQIVRLRKVMVLQDSEMPWRKRKFEQFVKDKLRAPTGLVLPNHHNPTKRSRRQLSHASSVSCLLNSVDSTHSNDEKIIFGSRTSSSLVTFDDVLPEKQLPADCSFVDDVAVSNIPLKDMSLDSDESVNGSNPLSPENSTPNEALPSEISNANSPISDGRRHLEPRRQSIRLLNFIGDHLQRKVIPVGPRFQADVPEWNGPADRSILIAAYKRDSENSKWLGSQVWPREIKNMETTGRKIGKGRCNSCCCIFPGSADCIKRHILDERRLLQRDLGPAFFSWKFDEMGEQVSKSWSPSEQQTFESLMKRKSSSNENSFWKHALKCLSDKCRKDIINYYFNVYIPHRMSLEMRSASIKQIDTDDEDESENYNYMGLQKRSEGRRLIIAKNTQARYLRST